MLKYQQGNFRRITGTEVKQNKCNFSSPFSCLLILMWVISNTNFFLQTKYQRTPVISVHEVLTWSKYRHKYFANKIINKKNCRSRLPNFKIISLFCFFQVPSLFSADYLPVLLFPQERPGQYGTPTCEAKQSVWIGSIQVGEMSRQALYFHVNPFGF
jgi:hypothetical protein